MVGYVRCCVFQDRCLQPLGHLSVAVTSIRDSAARRYRRAVEIRLTSPGDVRGTDTAALEQDPQFG
jgi:hypothetical protein